MFAALQLQFHTHEGFWFPQMLGLQMAVMPGPVWMHS